MLLVRRRLTAALMLGAVLATSALTACGAATGTASGGSSTGRHLPVAASAPGGLKAPLKGADLPAAKRAQRPNIVMVLMDDFSMDLVQTMRSIRTMRRAGASYSQAYVVDSLCCVSRSSIFTGQYPHQTGVRTNTSGQLDAMPLGGYSAFEGYGNPERAFNVTLQGSGYTTGFVGKYLNEYEYVQGRALPPMPPGWSQFNVVFGSAYDGWDFDSTYVRQGRLRVRHHAAPPLSAPVKQRDRAYAGSVVEKYAKKFIKAHRDDDAPYFLEVAPYAPHNRTQPTALLPGRPGLPAGVPRPAGPRPQGQLRAGRLHVADHPRPARLRRRPRRQPAAQGQRQAGAGLEHPAQPVPAGAERRGPAQPRDDGAVGRPHGAPHPAPGRRQHLRRAHLRQRLPPRPERPGPRQGHRLRHRRARPAVVVGPGVVPGAPHRADVQHRPRARPSRTSPASPSPAYRSGQSLVPTFGDPALVRRNHVFFEHTAQALTKLDPDSALNGDELDRVPSYVAVRSRTGLLIRYDMDTSVKRNAWAYEFYSYKNRTWEKKNAFAQPRHAAEVQGLMAKLAQWDQCAAPSGNQAVTPACRTLTQ